MDKLYRQLNEYRKWKNTDGYEFVVVDNSPLTENLQQKLVSDFGWIKFIFTKVNNGPSAARNIGLKNALGTFIQFVDDDDLITQKKVQDQVNFLLENPKIAVVIGGTQIQDWDLNELPIHKSTKIRYPDFDEVTDCSDLLKTEGFFQIGSALFKKEALLMIGGFDEKRWLIEDVNLYLRLFTSKARLKVDKHTQFGLFWRINKELSLSKKNTGLFLEARLSNYLFCLEAKNLESAGNLKIIFSGIYNILKQYPDLQKQLDEPALCRLKKLNFIERYNFLPVESLLSICFGFPFLFKLAFIYRKVKRKIIN